VTVLESAQALGEVGAGIQVSPNVSRLLLRWGLGPALERDAVRPEAIVFRRFATGERVGYTRWGQKVIDEFGVPYLHVHRADFHSMLHGLIQGRTEIRLNSTVVAVDPSKPSVTLASGEVVEADLIVGADGVKSRLREVVTGMPTPATATGDAAYRAIIPAKVLLDDPELRPFIETPEMTGWMAPGRHLMAYPIVRVRSFWHRCDTYDRSQRGKREYNLVLLHPDDGSVESWTAEGSADKMRADFADFEPRFVIRSLDDCRY
jgi:salicylate hydroxylase